MPKMINLALIYTDTVTKIEPILTKMLSFSQPLYTPRLNGMIYDDDLTEMTQ